MRAGKAYISSLGTTGLLIASSLLLLAVVGALVAFDGWPDNAAADTVVVPIDSAPAERAGNSRATRGMDAADRETRAARAALGAALADADTRIPGEALRAASVQVDSDSASIVKIPEPSNQVVSGLPAPDAAPGGGTSSPPTASQPAGPARDAPAPPTPDEPRLDDVIEILPDAGGDPQLTDVTAPLADSVAPLSPSLGGTLHNTGTSLDSLVDVVAP